MALLTPSSDPGFSPRPPHVLLRFLRAVAAWFRSLPEMLIGKDDGVATFKVGTLSYTRTGILVLFFWLIWNDFILMLMMTVKPALTGILLKNHGASNAQINFWLGTFAGVMTMWLNPFMSSWSDRTRTRWGRRRPFLLAATPPAAILLALIPWTPEIWAWLSSFPAVMGWISDGQRLSATGMAADVASRLAVLAPLSAQPGLAFTPPPELSQWGAACAFFAEWSRQSIMAIVLLMGFVAFLFTIFNGVIQAIFSYFFWDIVPKELLGRFNGVCRVVTQIKSFIWSYWVFGYAEHHMHEVYGGMAVLFLVIYTVSLLKVKEGQYPPPEERKSANRIEPALAYFRECFTEARYLWIYGAVTTNYLAQASGFAIGFYFLYDLQIPMDMLGKFGAWPPLIIAAVAYPIGAWVDRRREPLRLLPWVMFYAAILNFASYFLMEGSWVRVLCISAFFATMHGFGGIVWGCCFQVLNVEAFPRAKLGQFSSANYLFHSTINTLIAWPVGILFDWLGNYRYGYLWAAFWPVVSGLMFFKVNRNFRRDKALRDAELAAEQAGLEAVREASEAAASGEEAAQPA